MTKMINNDQHKVIIFTFYTAIMGSYQIFILSAADDYNPSISVVDEPAGSSPETYFLLPFQKEDDPVTTERKTG